jgi:hypothetical protein
MERQKDSQERYQSWWFSAKKKEDLGESGETSGILARTLHSKRDKHAGSHLEYSITSKDNFGM